MTKPMKVVLTAVFFLRVAVAIITLRHGLRSLVSAVVLTETLYALVLLSAVCALMHLEGARKWHGGCLGAWSGWCS